MALNKPMNLILSEHLQLSWDLVDDIHTVGLGLHMEHIEYESLCSFLMSTK